MKTIIAFLLIGAAAFAADDLFDASGNVTVAGGPSKDARSISDWCDLATTAKSAEGRLIYSRTLLQIATRNPKSTPAERVILRDASLTVLKNARNKPRSPSEAMDSDVRSNALWCLKNVGDESCLPTLFAVMSGPPTGEERTVAGEAIGAIGGKKAVDGLSRLAKSRDQFMHNPPYDLFNHQALEALGEMGSDDAQTAIKAIAAYASKTGNPSMAGIAARALAKSTEKMAAADDAKALAAKPGK